MLHVDSRSFLVFFRNHTKMPSGLRQQVQTMRQALLTFLRLLDSLLETLPTDEPPEPAALATEEPADRSRSPRGRTMPTSPRADGLAAWLAREEPPATTRRLQILEEQRAQDEARDEEESYRTWMAHGF